VAVLPLKNRRVVLGVGGGISAYKAADLARRLLESGAEVRCVMTVAAQRFITPLTLGALTAGPVVTDLFDDATGGMNHLALARWAQAVVVAPATADLLARLAGGTADDALTALLLATRAPVYVAPAMHTPMWEHPAVRRNVATCERFGYRFVGPVKGPLASGDFGEGRMEDPARIVRALEK
jgi:phosphopantothenoylcysteine decarboxylase/phosphopantothenate--cysteine ligase